MQADFEGMLLGILTAHVEHPVLLAQSPANTHGRPTPRVSHGCENALLECLLARVIGLGLRPEHVPPFAAEVQGDI